MAHPLAIAVRLALHRRRFDRRLIALFSPLAFALGGVPAAAERFDVGPAEPYSAIGEVPWEELTPGDSVCIHWRPVSYHEKWVICRVGTITAPIVVQGIPGPEGALPVIDGRDATTRSQLNFWGEARGVIKIGGANVPPDAMPAHILLENLEVRSGRPPYSFTGRDGLTAYAQNCAAVYVEKGLDVTIRNCTLADCANGLFAAWDTSDLVIEYSRIHDNGMEGSIYEHNTYTEALGILYQFNHLGSLRSGCLGNNLKDRSAGTVVRYNWISGGNRQLDLVDTGSPILRDDPRYRRTFVYGNILLEPGDQGNRQIVHYGGDSGDPTFYRHGTLYFHHNTVYSMRTGRTTLLRLSTNDETAVCRNSIVHTTRPGSDLSILDQDGIAYLRGNWLQGGWVPAFVPLGGALYDEGNLEGMDPGFANPGNEDFTLLEGSPCIDAAVALPPEALPDHALVSEYVRHASGRARPIAGPLDLGAFEHFSGTGVGNTWVAVTQSARSSPLRVDPNPCRARCVIGLEPGGGTPSGGTDALGAVEVVDAAGRIVARISPLAAARTVEWWPPSGLAAGLYVLRARSGSQAIIGRVLVLR